MGAIELFQTLKARLRDGALDAAFMTEVLDNFEQDPEIWQGPLRHIIERDDIALNTEVIEASQDLLERIDESGSSQGKYTVNIRGSQGVQIGDYNTQSNRFS